MTGCEGLNKPVGRLTKIGIDVSDLGRAAEFWSQVLGLEPGERREPYQSLGNLTPTTLLFLQMVPEPSTAKSRLHFDITVDDMDVAVERVLALGGSKLEEVGDSRGHLCVMADPDGNEFCLLPPGW